ncbi:YeeE/YedE thiosulfate transporter family protein [Alkaliphilus hydrothermalis]|uniref:Membrane protein YedE/YeeE n=1 Tax=Alkaliphilus hydrothermalis TaxID=1482730 RepID=A0ABS2NQF5_9FIRM|nr:YeeE/YedE thiosulfate transporter family protein [Alkaliphilus hydrothermalis]MBM7615172.1 putative membrane protein YedE/YeeE [Alkaliphilus hydrothermalis]
MSKAIEELKLKRQGQFKKRSNQVPYGMICIVLAVVIYAMSLQISTNHSTFWIIGILIGVTLQRSKFCFAASFRDPVLVGSTALLKAILLALIISTIGFVAIEYSSSGGSESLDWIRSMGQVHPVGIHTVIGAVLFGAGMVIAGGCASGFLMRMGEGFLLQIVVFFGFMMGAVLGTWHFEFWDKILISNAPTIFIPDYVGFPFATIGQVIILLLLYFLADWYDKKNSIMSM